MIQSQSQSLSMRSGYMTSAYNPDNVAAKLADMLATEDIKPDTLVGTGLSGAVIVPMLARELGIGWLVVRKPNDGSHSSKPAEGDLGRRWLFVDDFIETGATFERVWTAVQKLCQSRVTREWSHQYEFYYDRSDPWDTCFVGSYEYQTRVFTSPDYLALDHNLSSPLRPAVESVEAQAVRLGLRKLPAKTLTPQG